MSVDVGPDFFVHYSKIEMEGFRILEEGQHVQFIPAQGTRGPEAHHVRLIDSFARSPERRSALCF
ncbi:cold shock domain-containing protein [Streptomyces sp. NPDC056178]|uniref:cold shock domain-containing protein n=1 Tax=unclassified Streptomyces TaxID=2593676 RepID=UPI0035E0C6D7